MTEKNEEKVEVKEKQRGDEISTEDTLMDLSEAKNTLTCLDNFLKENNSMISELSKEVMKSKEAIMNASSSLESVKTVDVDDTEPIEYSISTIAPAPPAPPAPPPQRAVHPPAPVIRRNARLGGSRLGGNGPFLQCIYCGKINSDKISLARHLIAKHWAEVRENQGGGQFDNRRYYSHGIEDSRVVKTKQTRTAQPRPTTYQRPVEINKKITNASRNVQTSTRWRKIPNRKLSPPVTYIDLTTSSTTTTTSSSSETCEVCDDEFGWPEEGVEEHRKVCVRNNRNNRNRNKVQTPTRPTMVSKTTIKPLREPRMEKRQNSREIKKTQKYQKKKNQWVPGMEKLVKKITTSNSNIDIRLV